jgi:hypothetical protein
MRIFSLQENVRGNISLNASTGIPTMKNGQFGGNITEIGAKPTPLG